MKRSRRVAVIGVGILGASVGWNLSRHGAEVVFIDAGQPGEGVTNWSFSWVNASNKTERRSYFDLNVAGMAAHRELAGTIGPDSWWYPGGHLRWADDPAAEAKLLETAELLATRDYRVEVCKGAEVRRRLEPALVVPGEVSVVFYPDEAWVHGRHLVGRLVDRAAEFGAERRYGISVCDIGVGADGSIRTVALSDGELSRRQRRRERSRTQRLLGRRAHRKALADAPGTRRRHSSRLCSGPYSPGHARASHRDSSGRRCFGGPP